MAKAREDTLDTIARPTRGAASGNLNRRTTRTKDKRRPSVPAQKPVQLNVSVKPFVRDDFNAAYAASSIASKAKFMSALIDCWNEHDGTDANRQPSASDIAHGRTAELRVWARPELVTMFTRMSQKHGRTIGDVIDNIVGRYLAFTRANSHEQ